MELRLIIRWPSNRETIPDYPGGPDVHTWALKSSKRKLQGQRKRCKGRRGRRDSECEGTHLSWLTLKLEECGSRPRNVEGSQKPPADSQQRNWDFSPTTARKWIMPTTWMSKKKDSPLGPPEANAALLTSWFLAQWSPFLTHRAITIINVHRLKLLNLWLLWTQWRTNMKMFNNW